MIVECKSCGESIDLPPDIDPSTFECPICGKSISKVSTSANVESAPNNPAPPITHSASIEGLWYFRTGKTIQGPVAWADLQLECQGVDAATVWIREEGQTAWKKLDSASPSTTSTSNATSVSSSSPKGTDWTEGVRPKRFGKKSVIVSVVGVLFLVGAAAAGYMWWRKPLDVPVATNASPQQVAAPQVKNTEYVKGTDWYQDGLRGRVFRITETHKSRSTAEVRAKYGDIASDMAYSEIIEYRPDGSRKVRSSTLNTNDGVQTDELNYFTDIGGRSQSSREVKTSKDGSTYEISNTYLSREDGQPRREQNISHGLNIVHDFEYENGAFPSQKHVTATSDGGGQTTSVFKYEYNDHDQLLSQKVTSSMMPNNVLTTTYADYKYDDYGNWIERTQTDIVNISTITRKIEYFSDADLRAGSTAPQSGGDNGASGGEGSGWEGAAYGRELKDWTVYQDEHGSRGTLSEQDGEIAIHYSLGAGKWVSCSSKNTYDLSGKKGIRFEVVGSGPANTMEVKLTDKDGSVFRKLYPGGSSVTHWSTVEIPFSDFAYGWGGDRNLDLRSVKIEFAVSFNSASDAGGDGILYVQSISTIDADQNSPASPEPGPTTSSSPAPTENAIPTPPATPREGNPPSNQTTGAGGNSFFRNTHGSGPPPSKEQIDQAMRRAFGR